DRNVIGVQTCALPIYPPRPCAGRLREGTGRCRGHRGGLRRGDVSDRGQPEHVRTHGRRRWDSHRLRHLVPHLLDLVGQERYLARRPLRRSRVPRIRCRQGAVGSARTDLPRAVAYASRMVPAEVEHTLDRVLRIIGRKAAGRMGDLPPRRAGTGRVRELGTALRPGRSPRQVPAGSGRRCFDVRKVRQSSQLTESSASPWTSSPQWTRTPRTSTTPSWTTLISPWTSSPQW